ncbi:MAG: hypothetical protein A07HR60_02045 [uncultured archaeon A07HR60]|jgi:hypothetical protein|nr:MAG: hypothetical protein A07HR60_02045 [uncultured archaeon A07HR60]
MYEVQFEDPHMLTDGEETSLTIADYEDVGSMLILELEDGMTRSVGKQLVESVEESAQ